MAKADDNIFLKHLRIQVPDTHEVVSCMKHSLRCHQQLSESDVYWETVRNHPVQLESESSLGLCSMINSPRAFMQSPPDPVTLIYDMEGEILIFPFLP